MTKAERENDPADTFDGGYHLYAEEAHRERVAKNPSRISYAISQFELNNIEFVLKTSKLDTSIAKESQMGSCSSFGLEQAKFLDTTVCVEFTHLSICCRCKTMNERKHPSQLDQILAALENGDSITALDALEDYGCSRLASRITDLKRKGYPVASRMVTRRNRYGRLCRVAEYYMEV